MSEAFGNIILTLIYVRPLNEGQFPKLRHFEVGNFGQNISLLTAIMSIFWPLRGDRALFLMVLVHR